ncbi:tannase/feruloyl esterase family alpha/beta hydrolase [Acinetobacter pragensis]|uniref:Esterase n=1 Tax=Acinetobacter pragensis TaxID=1806892 RepID=A0A151Y3P2_9GAMM|nr:tannase/feruloyl esterase family alpha/beta hydrolase [Acinetobacter pragensis]KYQ72655.1 esterase [Acinetobacter pragensis]
MQKQLKQKNWFIPLSVLTLCVGLSACSDNDSPNTTQTTATIPQLSPAVGTNLKGACGDLQGFEYAHTHITSANLETAGSLKVAGQDIAAHCRITGYMYPRISPVDGQSYQIGFEMRLPLDWNGRFLYQGNGGTDGNIATATGQVGSGGPLSNALHDGFAVISSDAGHNASQNPLFGLDPQARIDYGYGAITKLTPMAKNLIQAAYGKLPDRSYAGGTSNGGRHAMMAATRLSDQYDGILASTPGFHLPRAAAAQLYTAQQLRRVATDENDLSTALTLSERKLLAQSILNQCDDLDGVNDGLVQDVEACRTAFDIHRDVLVCAVERDGSCLSTEQLDVLANIYRGPVNATGEVLYATQPFDPGLLGSNWANWKFDSSVGTARDPVAVGIIFQIPPDPSMMLNSRQFAFSFNFDMDYAKLSATNETYQESAMSFMLPPDELNLDQLQQRGGKIIVVQGTADGVFSVDDTQNWYDKLLQKYQNNTSGNAPSFVRFFRVPGMNHSSGGISTDQFDALTVLVNWVEYGQVPDRIVAGSRGEANLSGQVNTELPADWSANRTRPLCPYPHIARYNGQGDSELADNFSCKL